MARLIAWVTLAAAFAALSGCGADSGTTIQESPTAPGSITAKATTHLSGKDLFATKCGSCHTLAAAGTSGAIGPNLDQTKPPKSEVLGDIAAGPAVMPANLVTGKDADAVASFVAANAGK